MLWRILHRWLAYSMLYRGRNFLVASTFSSHSAMLADNEFNRYSFGSVLDTIQ